MYNPPNGRDEYVEIKNCGSETVSLFDEGYPENTWILKGFGFAFPQGVSLKSEQRALIITDTIRRKNSGLYTMCPKMYPFSAVQAEACVTVVTL